MTYGSETWTMRKEDEDVLIRAERRMIRMMCGVKLRKEAVKGFAGASGD